MPDDFTSPQFKRNVQGANRPLREFPPIGAAEDTNLLPHNAPITASQSQHYQDPFEMSQEEIKALKQARKDKANPVIAPSSKKRLEFLADLGRITKDVTINNTIFTLRTLKSKETKQIYMAVTKQATNGLEEAIIHRQYSLAFSIDKIDQQNLDILLDVNTFEDRLALVDGLEESTASQLYSAYDELRISSINQFSIKDNKDVQAVGEELKK